MKKVIDGRLYNTETAAKICDLPCSAYPSDFGWHETALYRSPKGAYFIAGEGGALSLWGQPNGNNGHGPGEGLRVLDASEAREIAERAGLEPEEFAAAGFTIEEG